MRVRFLGESYGKPVVEINGRAEELWVSDMPDMNGSNTEFGVSVEGMMNSDMFLEITNTDLEKMWRWKLDKNSGDVYFRGSKVAAVRP